MSFETDLLRGPSALGRLERLQQALQSIRVLQDGDTLIGFRELMPWHRSGGETYLAAAVAEVRSDSGCMTIVRSSRRLSYLGRLISMEE